MEVNILGESRTGYSQNWPLLWMSYYIFTCAVLWLVCVDMYCWFACNLLFFYTSVHNAVYVLFYQTEIAWIIYLLSHKKKLS